MSSSMKGKDPEFLTDTIPTQNHGAICLTAKLIPSWAALSGSKKEQSGTVLPLVLLTSGSA